MSSADGEAAGPGSGGCEDFAELLLGEVTGPEGMDGGSVQMLIEMAKSGDIDTVADTLSYLVEAGAPDKAAACLRRLMAGSKPADGAAAAAPAAGAIASAAPAPAPAASKPAPLNYSIAAKVVNRLVELGSLTEAQELLKFMLVARETDSPAAPPNVSRVLGAMVPEDAADSAGRILFALYSSDSDEDGAASQTLVPFILGTLLDHEQLDQAVELGKQLMYTTLEEIDAGQGEYDYSVLGWCMAQMVWYGRADWAAKLSVALEKEDDIDWIDGTGRHVDMFQRRNLTQLSSIVACGDAGDDGQRRELG
eukprot:XP_001691909.1 predicted protein [Chlamydomonas reinhardtii]